MIKSYYTNINREKDLSELAIMALNAKKMFTRWPQNLTTSTKRFNNQAWYYAMVRFRTIDLKSHPIDRGYYSNMAPRTVKRAIHEKSYNSQKNAQNS